MESLIPTPKVSLLIWICISISLVEATTKGDYRITPISNIKKIKSIQRGRETMKERSPDIAIDKKIKEIQPYLQDEEAGLKIEKENDDELILEFTPKDYDFKSVTKGIDKDPFRAKLRQYKKIRNKIKLALEKESVSDKTKLIVTKTLDDLTATLAQTQCRETLEDNDLKKFPILRTSFLNDLVPNLTYDSENNCYMDDVKLRNEDCAVIREPYKYCQLYGKNISEEECNRLVQFALTNKPCYIGKKKYNAEQCKILAQNVTDTLNMTSDSFKAYIRALLPSNDTQILNFYNSITKTVSEILQDSHKIPENYKVKCSMIDKENEKQNLKSKDFCNDFLVCSDELKEFLTVFYQNLNDTAVRVFRNYAAMYEKDIVTNDSMEKNTVMTAINKVGDLVGYRMSEVFSRTISKLELDENKEREMNIVALRDFVKHAVKTVNKTVNKHLEVNLSALSVRLLLVIKKDLSHNLASDLKNLESDVVKAICRFFVTCNGILPTVRRNYIYKNNFTTPRANSNNAIVNTKKTINDDFRKTILRNHEAMLRFETIIPKRKKTDYISKNITLTKTTPKTININPRPTTRQKYM